MKVKKDKIEFGARLKKIDIFSETLHIIVFPKGSLKDIGELYKIEQGQRIKVSIPILSD